MVLWPLKVWLHHWLACLALNSAQTHRLPAILVPSLQSFWFSQWIRLVLAARETGSFTPSSAHYCTWVMQNDGMWVTKKEVTQQRETKKKRGKWKQITLGAVLEPAVLWPQAVCTLPTMLSAVTHIWVQGRVVWLWHLFTLFISHFNWLVVDRFLWN